MPTAACPLLPVPPGAGPSSALETAAVGPRTCYHVATEPYLLPTMFNSPIKALDPSSSSSSLGEPVQPWGRGVITQASGRHPPSPCLCELPSRGNESKMC